LEKHYAVSEEIEFSTVQEKITTEKRNWVWPQVVNWEKRGLESGQNDATQTNSLKNTGAPQRVRP